MKPGFSVWHGLTLLALALPALYLAWAYPSLPAQIPTHFGLDGRADGFTAKAHVWRVAVALPLGVYALLRLLPRLDPKRRLDPGSRNFQKLQLALVALPAALGAGMLYAAQHPGAGFERVLLAAVALFFAFLGNYLTTVPPNYFVGVRTPWALEFPDNWARTHRLVGRLWFAGGLLAAGLVLALPPRLASPVLLGAVLGPAAVAYGYSYWLYRQALKSAAHAP